MDSAYESTFLFQSQFPLSATKQRSTQTGDKLCCIAEGRDTASWERSTNMVPLLKKKKRTWMIPPRLARYSLFLTYYFLIAIQFSVPLSHDYSFLSYTYCPLFWVS
jgi:hypothetical protein